MDVNEIPVEKIEQFATYKQIIRPASQSQITELFEAILRSLRLNRFTGQVTVHVNQGGIREVVTEQKTPHIAENSPAGKVLEQRFRK